MGLTSVILRTYMTVKIAGVWLRLTTLNLGCCNRMVVKIAGTWLRLTTLNLGCYNRMVVKIAGAW